MKGRKENRESIEIKIETDTESKRDKERKTGI